MSAARALAPVATPSQTADDGAALAPAERSFVGCLFWLSGAEGRAAIGAVRDADLSNPELRAVLAACRSLLADEDRADPALVTPLMVRAGWPTQLAGHANLLVAELVAEPLVPQGWRGYARAILAGAAARRVAVAGARLCQAAAGCQETEVLEALVSREASEALAELARARRALQ